MQIIKRDDWVVIVKFAAPLDSNQFKALEQKLSEQCRCNISTWRMEDECIRIEHTAHQHAICQILSQLAIPV